MSDTSTEAVKALIDSVRNPYGAFDHFHRDLADALSALLDERAATASFNASAHAQAQERIRELEAAVARFVGHDGDHYPEPGDTPCETDDTGVIHMR